jgi:hypothetical protein
LTFRRRRRRKEEEDVDDHDDDDGGDTKGVGCGEKRRRGKVVLILNLTQSSAKA